MLNSNFTLGMKTIRWDRYAVYTYFALNSHLFVCFKYFNVYFKNANSLKAIIFNVRFFRSEDYYDIQKI